MFPKLNFAGRDLINDLANGFSLVALVCGLAACASSGSAPASAPAVKTPSNLVSTWSEQFSAPDAATFFSPAYASIPGDPNKAMYSIGAGSPSLADGALTLANGRFIIGALGNTATTSSSTPGGIFAINDKSCALTVNVKSASGTGNFIIYVDNNTTSQGSSPHGNSSRAIMVGASSLKVGANTFKLTPSTSGFNEGSFVQIRADSASSVVIDSASMTCS